MVSARKARSARWLALAAALLSACGALESPVGDVSGRIVGAAAGGYAYPMGRPDLAVPLDVDADGVGTYYLADVPNTVPAIVLYDGAPAPDGNLTTPDGRAELVPIHLSGGVTNVVPDRYGAGAVLPAAQEGLRMPLAGTVLAAAVPEGGATPWRPTFDLPETVHADLVPAAGGVYLVWPLPAGRFDVGALLTGFVGAGTVVNVVSGATMAAPVPLPVDLGAPERGCVAVSSAAPAPCENGLVCEPSDGRCYECTASDTSHCSGNTCNLETHLCEAPAPSSSTWCSPCTWHSDCSSGMICRVLTGQTTGYCTTDGCGSDSDCPAGFDCHRPDEYVEYRVCRSPEGCDAWIQTMGAPCYSDDRCHDALEGGWCSGESGDQAGACTAACSTDEDCAVGTATNFRCMLSPSGSTPLRCVAQ